MGGGQTAPTIIRMAAPVGGAGGGQILRTIGGQQVVRVRAPAPTLASGQQIKVVGSSGQIIKSTTVSAAQAAQGKVETILKGSLDSIPSPSPSVKIQIKDGKAGLKCKGKTLPKKQKIQMFITIESRLPFKIFSTLPLLMKHFFNSKKRKNG